MIFLIDDNLSNQQESYGCDYISAGKYKDFLHYRKSIKTTERADFYEFFQNNASLLLIHGTSKDADKDGNFLSTIQVVEKLLKICESETPIIPFVMFSIGWTSGPIVDGKGNIQDINKKQFYGNLKVFLDNYSITGSIDCDILSKGPNYKKYSIIDKGREVENIIEKFGDDDLYKYGTNLELDFALNQFISNSGSKVSFNDFKNNFSNSLTIFQLKEMIGKAINSILKYGRNVYY
jgi:hypothetical protein